MITLRTYAKLNLCLYVGGVRADGYHPIWSIFQSISLHDVLSITPASDWQLTCSDPDIPTDSKNILTKIYTHYKLRIPGSFHIHIEKHIPAGGGLGGGSSNGAGFLAFLNTYCNWNLSQHELATEVVRFGADLPFFVYGNTAVVEGIGEKVTSISRSIYTHFVLLNPRIHLSTPQVYHQLDTLHPNATLTPPLPTTYATCLGPNDLQLAAFSLRPEFSQIIERLAQLNAPPVTMTGSGATLFMAFTDSGEADRWGEILRAQFPDYFVAVCEAV